MILKTSVGELLNIINSVWETTDVKISSISSKVLLKGIHKADESWLYVYATDYDTQALGKLQVELNESFCYVVDPDELVKGIRTLNHETEVIITIDNKLRTIKAGVVKYKISVSEEIKTHTTSLAAIPVLDKSNCKISPLKLLHGFIACTFAVSKNQSLYGVTRTMEVAGEGTSVTFSASDGSIAAYTSIKCEEIKEPFKFNLSREHIRVFSNLLNMNKAGDIDLYSDINNSLYFKFHELLFVCGKVTGKLPSIKALVEKQVIKSRAKVNSKLFKEALRRAALFTGSLSKPTGITLSVKEKKLVVSTTDFEELVEASFESENNITVRKDYLLECIASCKGEEVEVCFLESGQALMIKDSLTNEDVELSSSYILTGMV